MNENKVNPFVSRQTPDVLEVLTEVDEKSRRCPEMIQYFIVSVTQMLSCMLRSGVTITLHSFTTTISTTAVCLSVSCRTTCRDS